MAIIKKGLAPDGLDSEYDSDPIPFVPAHDLLTAQVHAEHMVAIAAALKFLSSSPKLTSDMGESQPWQIAARIRAISK